VFPLLSFRTLVTIAAGWACLTVIGVASVESQVQALRQRAEVKAQESLTLAAAGVAQQVQRTMDAVATLHQLGSILLGSAADEAAGGGTQANIERHLRDLATEERFGVLQVALVRTDGVLHWSTLPDHVPVDLSDREHVQVHLRDGRQAAFVSAPLIGRASRRWSIQVTRPALDRHGRLAGVVVVSLDPYIVSQDLAALKVLPEGVATLVRPDGTVLARSDDGDQHLGSRVPEEAIRAFGATPGGVARFASSLSGGARYVAWQSLVPLPVIVVVSLPTGVVDAEVAAARRMLFLVFGSVALLVLALGCTALVLHDRQRARLAAERAAQERREMTELLDALPAAAYRSAVSASGEVSWVQFGRAVTRIVGALGDASCGDPLAALLSPEAAEARRQMLGRAARTGFASLEYQVQAAGGERLWLRDDCRRLRLLADGSSEVVGAISDMTEDRALKARAAASARLATLGEMATGMAHELNQPSTAIALAADIAALALDRGDAAGIGIARQRLERIATQATRIRAIIDHLQIFTRSDEGAPVPVRLDLVVAGALQIAEGTLHAAGVRVRCAVPPDLPAARGRVVPLEQVLVNLLINARDAMKETPPEEREIAIGAEADLAAGLVRLTVADSGHGIDADVADRAFEPFFTTKPVGKGTGLGLSIAYGTMRSFGGEITLQNRAGGKGAVATMTLALWHASHDSDAAVPAMDGKRAGR
jgi:C4-dicarboxylate-specific signal transduction histidine kinase